MIFDHVADSVYYVVLFGNENVFDDDHYFDCDVPVIFDGYWRYHDIVSGGVVQSPWPLSLVQ